jgi:hypothetical protein
MKYERKFVKTYSNGITGDIVTTLNSCFRQSVKDTKKFSQNFITGDIYESANKLWNFVKKNIKYLKDPDGKQIIQLPGALLHRRKTGGDCKSMSLFISSILYNLGAENVRLRYVSYNNNPTPTHVYTVFDYNGRTVAVDSVIDKFDHEKNYTFKTNYKMDVFTLSGVGSAENANKLKKVLMRVKPDSLCAGLIKKQIARENGVTLPQTNVNPVLSENYGKRLKNHLNWHIKNNKTGICFQLIQQEYNDLLNNNIRGGIAGIGRRKKRGGKGNIFQRAARGAKTVALAPVRNAFLGVVELNLFGYASRIKKANQSKMQKFWEGFGGDFSKLTASVNRGSKKKAILSKRGINGLDDNIEIGAAPSAAAILAAAAPILAAISKILGREPAPKFDAEGNELPGTENPDPSLFDKIVDAVPTAAEGLKRAAEVISVDADGNTTRKPGVEVSDTQKSTSNFAINPKILIFGGAALVGAFLLTRKK